MPEARGDEQLIADVQCLSLRLGEEGAVDYLMRCARGRSDGGAGPDGRDRAKAARS